MKPKRPPRIPWKDHEDNIIRQWFPRLGTAGVQKRLTKVGYERTRVMIARRAQKIKVYFKPDCMRHQLAFLSEADAYMKNGRCNVTSRRILTAAKSDGVAVRAGAYPHKWMAPTQWVDDYMDKRAIQVGFEMEARSTWFGADQVARLFGLTPGSFKVMIAPSRPKQYTIMEYLDRIPHALVGRKRYFKPEEAVREAERYLARKSIRGMRLRRQRAERANRLPYPSPPPRDERGRFLSREQYEATQKRRPSPDRLHREGFRAGVEQQPNLGGNPSSGRQDSGRVHSTE